jgi:hypothetical protein
MRSAQVQNAQRAQAPSQPPLSAEEIWSQAVQPKRGFEARPYNATDRYRGIPAAPLNERLADGIRGGPVGFGVDTVGSVQLVDVTGKRSWVAVGHFTKSGLEAHAEIRCLNALKSQAPQRLHCSRLMVVVDQEVCPYCQWALTDFALGFGRPANSIRGGERWQSIKSICGLSRPGESSVN